METLDANALGHACAAASVPRPRYLQQKHARLLSSSPDAATPPRSSIALSRRNSAAAALLGFSLRHGFLPVEPRSPLGGGARTRSPVSADVALVSPDVVPHARPRSTLAAHTVSASLVVSDSDAVLQDSDAVLPDSDEVLQDSDAVLPDSVEELPDSDELLPDSIEVQLEYDAVLPDSVDVLPDSDQLDEVVHCPRCGTFHAGGVFGDECYQARCEACRCACCGLLHEDYDMIAKWLDYLDKFDCEIYIPDVSKLQMDGNTIILPEHVINKLDKIRDAKKLELAKLKQDANKEQ